MLDAFKNTIHFVAKETKKLEIGCNSDIKELLVSIFPSTYSFYWVSIYSLQIGNGSFSMTSVLI